MMSPNAVFTTPHSTSWIDLLILSKRTKGKDKHPNNNMCFWGAVIKEKPK